MNKKIFKSVLFVSILLVICFGATFDAASKQFTLNGTIDNKLPIVIEVDRTPNGAIKGRYTYRTGSYDKGQNGEWFYIKPYNNTTNTYVITDSDGNLISVWESVRMYRERGINYLSGTITNNMGDTHVLDASSASTNTSTWAGTYVIEGSIYRGPTTSITLTLQSNGKDSYTGKIKMEETEGYDGILTGNVSAKAANGVLLVTLNSYTTRAGENGNILSGAFPRNCQILRISKTGSKFDFVPLGGMEDYMDGMSTQNTIVKTK